MKYEEILIKAKMRMSGNLEIFSQAPRSRTWILGVWLSPVVTSLSNDRPKKQKTV
jgi:hypothetical protein